MINVISNNYQYSIREGDLDIVILRTVFPNLGSAESLGSVGILKGFRQISFRLCSMQCFSTGARLHLFIDLYPGSSHIFYYYKTTYVGSGLELWSKIC